MNPRRQGNWRSISGPVVIDDLVIAPYARGDSLTAFRLGGQGDVTDTHVAWSSDRVAADAVTPASICPATRVFHLALLDRRFRVLARRGL